MKNTLKEACNRLRLSGLLSSLELRLQEARTHQVAHAEFLETLLQDELNVREQRGIERRKKQAQFRNLKTLEEFDWNFNPSIDRKQIYRLATGAFIQEKIDLIFIGQPGTGKSFLAQSLGYCAIKAGRVVRYCSVFDLVRELQRDQTPEESQKTLMKYLKPELLCIDDFGMKQFAPKSAEYLLEIIVRRHQTASTLMTSNRPIEDWGRLLADAPAATAILDRFLQQAEVIQITGRSYRMHLAQQRGATGSKKKKGGQTSENDQTST